MIDLDELNLPQRQAVECCDKPSLVIAGAGSGKTRVLTYKISYLLEHMGYGPEHILALTFTNKAAREMRERVCTQVGEMTAARLWMGTFHSIFARILRANAPSLGLTSNFTIYDATDSKNQIKNIIKELNLNDKQYKPSSIMARISRAKNALLLPHAYEADGELQRCDVDAKVPMTSKIYSLYYERCRQSNALDFDDLLLCTWMLFSEQEEILRRYQERFKYVLVDEYQDTNYAQHEIVRLLTQRHHHVCVVGDDAQSIYSFRGAKIDNILKFKQIFSDAILFKLEQNYRSTQTIVNAANSLIRHNRRQIPKTAFSKNDVGSPIWVKQSYSDVDEANILVRCIRYQAASLQVPYKDMAVLYRTNAQSRCLEDSLRLQHIPYRIFGGLSFYQHKEIKDLLAYFRLAINPQDEEALRRVINYPTRGIGTTTLEKIMSLAYESGIPAIDALNSETLQVNQGMRKKLQAFHDMIKDFHSQIEETDAHTLGQRILQESGIYKDIQDSADPEAQVRKENIEEMLDGLNMFVIDNTEEGVDVRLTDYVQQISLSTDFDEKTEGEENVVTLMTVHAAKGLEFRSVFVTGLEEELFPASQTEIEEERRLFYVAMTRAREYLTLLYAKSRFRFGEIKYPHPSCFLTEIDGRFLKTDMPVQPVSNVHVGYTPKSPGYERPFTRPSFTASETFSPKPSVIPKGNFKRVNAVRPKGGSVSRADSPAISVSIGSRIEHDRFGLGVVRAIEGTGMDTKATVEFTNAGSKTLLLRFAKFKVLT